MGRYNHLNDITRTIAERFGSMDELCATDREVIIDMLTRERFNNEDIEEVMDYIESTNELQESRLEFMGTIYN